MHYIMLCNVLLDIYNTFSYSAYLFIKRVLECWWRYSSSTRGINYRDSPALVPGCVMEDYSDWLDYCNAL